MTPTQQERSEWARMAQDAYRHGLNFFGHRYSAAAARPAPFTLAEFDGLTINYRKWLLSGWAELTA